MPVTKSALAVTAQLSIKQMAQTFYFYDLETSSGSPRGGRIMQFAGQRTDEQLKPIGKPDNFLVKLAPDVLPEPEAILVHGITPQKAIAEGISEAELVQFFESTVSKPGTIFVGFNNIRFDDEFIRRLMYRSLRDPYGWHWQDGRGRWDLMDPLRMMRALRPDGFEWPFAPDGKPTVRLESMSSVNKIKHNAHDALGDVTALIELTARFKQAQPKLFSYLLSMRDKKMVAKLVEKPEPFLYTSGKYSGDYLKTTVVTTIVKHPKREAAVVYNLRVDPTPYLGLSAVELAARWREYDPKLRLPIKTVQYNHCPAVAPTSVLDQASIKRLSIDQAVISNHQKQLADNPEFARKVLEALEVLDQKQASLLPEEGVDVDEAIYDGFWSDSDKVLLQKLVKAEPQALIAAAESQESKKISELGFRYVARNYPNKLTSQQHERWEAYRQKTLLEGGEKSRFSLFFNHLSEASKRPDLSANQKYLLTEAQLYAETIMPEL